MTDEPGTRKYRKRKRAASEKETRQRITEAAVELHGTVGPANTTTTEVARRAGVTRMTVYNHFPTDADLFTACSTHWAEQNPLPDPACWARITEPAERLGAALTDLYVWYDRKESMLGKVWRDAPLVPALAEVMGGFWGEYESSVIDVLAHGWSPAPEDERTLRTLLGLVLDFHTWSLLRRRRGDDREAAALAARMVVRTLALTPGRTDAIYRRRPTR